MLIDHKRCIKRFDLFEAAIATSSASATGKTQIVSLLDAAATV